MESGSKLRPFRLDPLDEKLNKLRQLGAGRLLDVLGHRDHDVAVAVEGDEPPTFPGAPRVSRHPRRSPLDPFEPGKMTWGATQRWF